MRTASRAGIRARTHARNERSCWRTDPDTTFPPLVERETFTVSHIGQKRFLEFTRHRSIVDAYVAFFVMGKRSIVEVRRANRRPDAVDHHGFVMQQRAVVLEYRDIRLEKLAE